MNACKELGMFFGTFFALFLLIPMFLVLFNRCLPKWFCTRMGWHLKPKDITVAGINSKGTCPRCGGQVMLDSQGNWFG